MILFPAGDGQTWHFLDIKNYTVEVILCLNTAENQPTMFIMIPTRWENFIYLFIFKATHQCEGASVSCLFLQQLFSLFALQAALHTFIMFYFLLFRRWKPKKAQLCSRWGKHLYEMDRDSSLGSRRHEISPGSFASHLISMERGTADPTPKRGAVISSSCRLRNFRVLLCQFWGFSSMILWKISLK